MSRPRWSLVQVLTGLAVTMLVILVLGVPRVRAAQRAREQAALTLERQLCRELLDAARSSTDTILVLANSVRLTEPCLVTLTADTPSITP